MRDQRYTRRTFVFAVCVVLALSASGCTGKGGQTPSGGGSSKPAQTKGPITVGSKVDVEGPLLGEMIIAVLEDHGFKTVDKTRTGTTDVVRKALLAGEIDMYPEYTATAATQFFKGVKYDPAILKDAQKVYDFVSEQDLKQGVVWLGRAPANNTWSVAIPRKLMLANNITTLTDWATYINGGGAVQIVGSQEFFNRSDAFPAFEKAYGFKLNANQMIALTTGDTAITEKAAAQGTNGANAAMAYGTDGSIGALDLVLLKDPKGVQPIYQPAPTVRKQVADRYPELGRLLDPVFAKLDLATLQQLNGKISVNGEHPKTVARDWLESEGLLGMADAVER